VASIETEPNNDDLPEDAFRNCGAIEDAVEKAKQMNAAVANN